MIYAYLLLIAVEVESASGASFLFLFCCLWWEEIYVNLLFGSAGWFCWNLSWLAFPCSSRQTSLAITLLFCVSCWHSLSQDPHHPLWLSELVISISSPWSADPDISEQKWPIFQLQAPSSNFISGVCCHWFDRLSLFLSLTLKTCPYKVPVCSALSMAVKEVQWWKAELLYTGAPSCFCSLLFPLLFPQPKSSNRLTTCQEVILTPRKHLISLHICRGLRHFLRVLREIPTSWWLAVVPAQQKKGNKKFVLLIWWLEGIWTGQCQEVL